MAEQLEKLEIRVEKYFDKWFPAAKVRTHFEDHVGDVRKVFEQCQPSERTRLLQYDQYACTHACKKL